MKITLYHNPKCATSRKGLALLRDNGVEPEIVDYLKTGIDAKTLAGLVKLLKVKPRDIVRKKDAKDAGIDPDVLSDKALIDAMVAYPRSIERPIAVKGKKAVLGRPVDELLKLV